MPVAGQGAKENKNRIIALSIGYREGVKR